MTRPLHLCLVALAGAGAGAQQLTVRGPEPEIVRAGETAVVTLAIDGVERGELGVLPAIDGVLLAAEAPRTATSHVLHGGELAAEPRIAWSIRVTPARPGSITLPPMAATAGGQTFTAPSLRLEALPALAELADGADPTTRALPDVADVAFIELSAARATWFLHERVTVRVRFGFEHTFEKTNLVPMFARATDIAAQIRAGWWTSLPHAAVVDAEATTSHAARTCVLNESIAGVQPLGDVVRDGRSFSVFEITRTFLPTHSGELVVPGPALRFAYATQFDDDFVNGRVARDRREGLARAPALTLRIEPWPAEGRPAWFNGAVGRFTVHAQVQPTEVVAGGSVKVVLRIAGEGNLGLLGAPRLDGATDFHLLGKVEETTAAERIVTYDLSPLRAGATLPPIAFAYFDPTPPGAYRQVTTAALELRVLAAVGDGIAAAPTSARNLPGATDIFDLASTRIDRRSGSHDLPSLLVAAALMGPWLAAIALAIWQRTRARAARDAFATRARQAAAAFHARIEANPADAYGACLAYLAARLRCSEASVIGPELQARLVGAGIAHDLARRAVQALDALAAAHYGGTREGLDLAALRDLIGAVEASFRAR